LVLVEVMSEVVRCLMVVVRWGVGVLVLGVGVDRGVAVCVGDGSSLVVARCVMARVFGLW
jgi:hypothetical protein